MGDTECHGNAMASTIVFREKAIEHLEVIGLNLRLPSFRTRMIESTSPFNVHSEPDFH